MSLLLDTHVWIWTQESPEKLGPETTSRLTAPETVVLVSTVSTLEIARFSAMAILKLQGPLEAWIDDTLEALRCGTIEISHEIAAAAYALPGEFHKDPADRILVATARLFELTLLTADGKILAYPHVRSQDARR